MGRLVFSDNGIVVHLPNPGDDALYESRGANPEDDYEEFEGRRPVIWNTNTRNLYVGEPYWWHADLEGHHKLDYNSAHLRGYVQGGPQWGNGNLRWYGDDPEMHNEIAHSLEAAGIPVPNKKPHEEEDDSDLWSDHVAHHWE